MGGGFAQMGGQSLICRHDGAESRFCSGGPCWLATDGREARAAEGMGCSDDWGSLGGAILTGS